ncbi:MAG: c-type cytochrome [Verrucomicrobiales bacterium]|nr:c-type cytochrome [Verrucomicrobiales bacterium]
MKENLNIKNIVLFATTWGLTVSFLGAADPKPDSEPVAAKDALSLLHVPEGFEVELLVSEPDVIDPVAFTWGADGRLWVVEMSDYPLGMDNKGKAGGRVRWLKDTNGDGKYDQSVVFAEGLSFPNGILPWKKGVLVTAAPLILYLEDTDADGVSDKKHVLFEGFQEGNQQLRVNGLIRGLDNWIYCASGSHSSNYGAGSKIKSIKTGQEIDLGSRDFRFNPETGELDPQSGPSQFGRNRSDWGDWFGEMNSYPIWHYVLQDSYIRRNPHAASPDPRKQLVEPRNPKVFPFKGLQKRFHAFAEAGRFTSACDGMIYRDAKLFPQSAADTIEIFTCEPFANLIQHNRSEPDGVSFTVSKNGPVEVKDKLDFFASKDRWSRPVMSRTGPDGALWVADMYRYMIEHPQWLPQEGRDELRPFYRLGDDKGRIYRVYRKGQQRYLAPNLAKLSNSELVAALETRNGWQRDTAQALLVERNDKAVVSELKKMATGGKLDLARLHALYTLQGMGELEAELLQVAAGDLSPGVQQHAVKLSEGLAENHPELLEVLLGLSNSKNARVRMQLAYSLGEWSGKAAAKTLGKLAFSDGVDAYMAAAIISSVNTDNLSDVLASLMTERANAKQGNGLLGRLLMLAVAFDNDEAVTEALDAVMKPGGNPVWQFTTVAGLLDALDRRAGDRKASGELAKTVNERVKALTVSARKVAVDDKATEASRKAAIRLLARGGGTQVEDIEILGSLLGLQTPLTLQVATVSHLGTLSGEAVPKVLLAGWTAYTPAIRTEVLNVLTTRGDWLMKLLDGIEAKKVAPADLDAGIKQRLTTHSDKKVQVRAKGLLPSTSNADRLKVMQAYRPALKLKGDKARGKLVFQKVCVACHKLDGMGLEIGPNLASITDRKPESLLSGILDPNQSVEGKYSSYVASTKDGRAILGILISETGSNITILDQANQKHVILRSELKSLTNTGRSLMPDGLEGGFDQQELADLIEYVAAAK